MQYLMLSALSSRSSRYWPSYAVERFEVSWIRTSTSAASWTDRMSLCKGSLKVVQNADVASPRITSKNSLERLGTGYESHLNTRKRALRLVVEGRVIMSWKALDYIPLSTYDYLGFEPISRNLQDFGVFLLWFCVRRCEGIREGLITEISCSCIEMEKPVQTRPNELPSTEWYGTHRLLPTKVPNNMDTKDPILCSFSWHSVHLFDPQSIRDSIWNIMLFRLLPTFSSSSSSLLLSLFFFLLFFFLLLLFLFSSSLSPFLSLHLSAQSMLITTQLRTPWHINLISLSVTKEIYLPSELPPHLSLTTSQRTLLPNLFLYHYAGRPPSTSAYTAYPWNFNDSIHWCLDDVSPFPLSSIYNFLKRTYHSSFAKV